MHDLVDSTFIDIIKYTTVVEIAQRYYQK